MAEVRVGERCPGCGQYVERDQAFFCQVCSPARSVEHIITEDQISAIFQYVNTMSTIVDVRVHSEFVMMLTDLPKVPDRVQQKPLPSWCDCGKFSSVLLCKECSAKTRERQDSKR